MPRKHSFCGGTPTVRRIIIASTLALLSLICTRTTRRGSMCASTECPRDMTTHLEALITIKPFFILLNWSVEVCLVHLIIKIAKLFVLNALGITSCSQLHTELTSMLPFLSSCFFCFACFFALVNQLYAMDTRKRLHSFQYPWLYTVSQRRRNTWESSCSTGI